MTAASCSIERSPRRLPLSESVDTVSAACRHAGLAFTEGVAAGWGKRDLAGWLAGPYAAAVRHATAPFRPRFVGPRDLREERISLVMEAARFRTLAMLEALALPSADSPFIQESVKRGLVTVAEDELGTSVWVPVDVAGLRLHDRVRALFAADYLLNPTDYQESFFVCHRCERVLFDAETKWLGFCRMHLTESTRPVRHQSGIELRAARRTQ